MRRLPPASFLAWIGFTMDIGSLLGLVISFGLILLGNALEGGHIDSLIAPTAMMIVLGGTTGACVLQFPMSVTIHALKSIMHIFFPPKRDPRASITQLVEFAKRARREGSCPRKRFPRSRPLFSRRCACRRRLEPKQLSIR